jgi:hypothetical protein
MLSGPILIVERLNIYLLYDNDLHWLVLSVRCILDKFQRKDFWWQKVSDTPVPIPNTEVKPDTIDDSSPEADCENRLPPDQLNFICGCGGTGRRTRLRF